MPPGGWDARPPQPEPVTAPPAGWWRRAAATLLDGLIVAIPVAAVSLMLFIPLGILAPGELFDDVGSFLVGLLLGLVSLLAVVLVALVALVLYAGFTMSRPVSRNGQTLGKQALGIRVIRLGGDPSTFASAVVREAAIKGLLFGAAGGLLLAIPTVLDLLWPLWDRDGRALHDMLANTRVVHA